MVVTTFGFALSETVNEWQKNCNVFYKCCKYLVEFGIHPHVGVFFILYVSDEGLTYSGLAFFPGLRV
jgi:hypothetical protein